MKWNWGFGILIVYMLFVVGMVVLVIMSTVQNKDLVTENYYAEEIAFQKTINQSYNTSKLSSKIEVIKKDDTVKIMLPKEFSCTETKCNWVLYFAADKTRDKEGVLLIHNAVGFINLHDQIHGTYTLKLKIKEGNHEYYFEKLMLL